MGTVDPTIGQVGRSGRSASRPGSKVVVREGTDPRSEGLDAQFGLGLYPPLRSWDA